MAANENHCILSSSEGTNKFSAARQNRIAVLRLLFKDLPLSQRRLAALLHLRASTLSNITAELREAGLVREGDLLSGNRVGPPERALCINAVSAWGCGLEIDKRGHRLTLLNGAGELIGEQNFTGQCDLQDLLCRIPVEISRLRDAVGLADNPHGGLAVSIQGIVDPDAGRVVLSRPFGLSGYPLRQKLASACDFPVWVDRNVCFGAYHECVRAEGRQWDNFAYFLARSPVPAGRRVTDYSLGMAFVIGNRIYRGYNHAAGELDTGIFPDDSGHKTLPSGDPVLRFREYCTRHLASVINLMDLGKLVVAADSNLVDSAGFPDFEECLRAHLLPLSERNFTVRLAVSGPDGICRGAGLFAVHRSLENRLLAKPAAC